MDKLYWEIAYQKAKAEKKACEKYKGSVGQAHSLVAYMSALLNTITFPESNTTTLPESNVKISINAKSKVLYSGQNTLIKATVSGTASDVKWKSNNEEVAVVNSSGKVTAKKVGTATITAWITGKDNKIKKATCSIKVKKNSVKLNKSKATIYVSGINTVKLIATVSGVSSKVRWSSNNTSVAKVDSTGKVTAKKAGVATIAATANGVTAKCTVTVKDNRSSSGKNYKCIITSGSDASKRKVGNVTFSWKSQYINGSGTYNSIYVTKGNKTTLVARMKDLSAYVISDGQEVFYSAGREQSIVYRKKLSDKTASSVFRKRTDYGFGLSLSGFYNNTLYYVDGIDPGKFRSYSLSSKRHSTILGDTASVEQKNQYFYLQPSFGDVGYRSRLSVYNAKTKKTQLISDRLNVMFEYKIIGNMLYYVEHTGVSNYYRSPYTISVKRCKLDGSGKTTLVSGLTVREIRSLDSRSISYLDRNGYQKTKFY